MAASKIFIILLLVIAYGILLFSASFLDLKKKVEQDINPITHFPVWHPPSKMFYDNPLRSIGLLTVVITLITTIIAYRYTYFRPPISKRMQSYFCSSDNNDSNNSALRRISTLSFNKTLAHYSFATFASSVAYYFVDPSKIFLPFGALHNLFEMAMLMSFLTGGRIKNVSQFFLLFTYLLSINIICAYIDWPYDALFFKFQGLILDFALVVEFTRIYLNTKYYMNNFEQQDLNPDNDDIEEPAEDHETVYLVNHPTPLLILVFASATHLFGNIYATFFLMDLIANFLFTITYSVAFFSYIFYLYLDTNSVAHINSKKFIYLPTPTKWSSFVIAASCLFGSMLTMVIGLALS